MLSSSDETDITAIYDYNKFFHPNICHFCKRTDHLTLCSGCLMISYCSEDHRMRHLPQHNEICKAIGKMCMVKNWWHTRGMTRNEWIIHQKKNIQTIQLIMYRKLEPYEEQMFLFAKSCCVCHQQSYLTIVCPECFSINKCDDHRFIKNEHNCRQLKISLCLDINAIQILAIEILQHNFPKYVYATIANSSIDLIIQQYREQCTNEQFWTPNEYKYFDSISSPLTVCYTISHLNLDNVQKKEVVICIINGAFTDIQNVSAWEIVLHVLDPGTYLKIILLGPALRNAKNESWNLCNTCDALHKGLNMHVYDILYEDYVQCALFVTPDLIVGFHVEFRKLGASLIRELYRQNVPLLLTTTSADKALDNARKLDEVLGKCPKPRISMENMYRSHRPYRDLESDTFFRNNYLTIYDKLNFKR